MPDVDHAAFGEVETVKLTRIQRISGPRLHASWVNLPHVTQNDNADITELEAKRQALKGELGDVLWYLTQICTELDLKLEDVAEANIVKLFSRLERDQIRGDGDNR